MPPSLRAVKRHARTGCRVDRWSAQDMIDEVMRERRAAETRELRDAVAEFDRDNETVGQRRRPSC